MNKQVIRLDPTTSKAQTEERYKIQEHGDTTDGSSVKTLPEKPKVVDMHNQSHLERVTNVTEQW